MAFCGNLANFLVAFSVCCLAKCQCLRLECQHQERSTDIVVLQDDGQILSCFVASSDGVELVLPPGNTSLSAIVKNSTWQKQYAFQQNFEKTAWNLELPIEDFFHEVTDYTIPPAQSPIYSHVSLKWFVHLELCHPTLARCLRKKMVAVHKDTHFMDGTRWGVPEIHAPDWSPASYVIPVNAPCQSGSSMLIIGTASDIYFAFYWNGTAVLHKWHCSLSNLESCAGLVVYDSVMTEKTMVLVTSKGLLVADAVGTYESTFRRVELDASDGIVWQNIKLSFSPFCAEMDYYLPQDDVVLMLAPTTNGQQNLYRARSPYTKWSRLQSQTTHGVVVSTLHDRQTASIITIACSAQNCVAAVYASDMTSPKYPPFVLMTSVGGAGAHALMLSNHYAYASVGNGLWLSTDGGNLFKRIATFSSSERVIRMIGYEPTKAFAFMTSQGWIWHGQAGITQPERLLHASAPYHSKTIVFDHVGRLILVSVDVTRDDVISREVVFAPDEDTYHCSFTLTGETHMRTVQSCDLGQTVEYSLTVKRKPESLSARGEWVSVNFGNPRIFRSEVSQKIFSPFERKITVKLSSLFLIKGATSVAVNLRLNERCPITSHNVIVLAVCPALKQLHFNYSTFLGSQQALGIDEYVAGGENASIMLQELAVNYRPPSALAVSIPLSSNVYNVHPEKINNTGLLTYDSATPRKLKRYCEGKASRSACSCSSALKFSSLERYSDCREKVYKVMYDMYYNIKLSINAGQLLHVDDLTTDDVATLNMTQFLVYFEEVNGRDESVYTARDHSDAFCVEHPEFLICQSRAGTSSSEKLLNFMTAGRSKMVYNASNLSIKFLGSGLFHFRIRVAEGFSFCELQDEFQVYVTNPPLPFPTGTIIRLIVSFAMGTAMIVIYMKFLFSQPLPENSTGTENAQEASAQRRNTSFVSENDIAAIRSKLRASIHA